VGTCRAGQVDQANKERTVRVQAKYEHTTVPIRQAVTAAMAGAAAGMRRGVRYG
jgi:hypothetical protein